MSAAAGPPVVVVDVGLFTAADVPGQQLLPVPAPVLLPCQGGGSSGKDSDVDVVAMTRASNTSPKAPRPKHTALAR
jgi:hypothetical protein